MIQIQNSSFSIQLFSPLLTFPYHLYFTWQRLVYLMNAKATSEQQLTGDVVEFPSNLLRHLWEESVC
ncbi:hypothetical protein J437_LFUL010583 [Ladona fulva]|uniref:Uncharacterized protein n=1 Tax=Ladona fulva TaxID=123851 RepID=A0A8K0KEC2_LADFU|nr:hypothetical protein J437_LFUL010583 [Ladona fulva]